MFPTSCGSSNTAPSHRRPPPTGRRWRQMVWTSSSATPMCPVPPLNSTAFAADGTATMPTFAGGYDFTTPIWCHPTATIREQHGVVGWVTGPACDQGLVCADSMVGVPVAAMVVISTFWSENGENGQPARGGRILTRTVPVRVIESERRDTTKDR